MTTLTNEEAFEKWFKNTVLNDSIHDVTLWAWQAAKADSEREITLFEILGECRW